MSSPEKAYSSVFPETSVKTLRQIIAKSRKAGIVTHYDADGDAIGSSLALYHYLKAKEIPEIRVFTPNPYPAFLHWLPGHEAVFLYEDDKDLAGRYLSACDLLVFVDFNTLPRLKKMMTVFDNHPAFKVLIDHHPDPDIKANLIFSDTRPSSTSEIIYYLISNLGDENLIDKPTAENLFTGIMTDTGCFSFNSSQPATWHAVGRMLLCGIDKDRIFSQVYENYSDSRMRLMGYCLNEKLKIIPEYHTAYISLTLQELEQFNFVPGDSEGFVNLPFSIAGIQFTAFFIEKNDHIKISLRSKGKIPVNLIAREHFKGGGHQNAAGGESELPMTATLEKFISLLPQYENWFQ